MTKKLRLWIKASILAGLIVVGIFSIISQVSAFPTMSTDPSDPSTCLRCHPSGAPGTEEEPATTETAPVEIVERPPSAPYPATASPDVVWSIYLTPYTDWDNLYEIEGAIAAQPLVFDDLWDAAYEE